MGEVDYRELKKGGFMRQIQKNNFSMRLKSVGGHLTAVQLDVIQKVAEKYGQGYVHLTSRQGVEIPFINIDKIEEVKKQLAKGGVSVGACGPRVRTITACQGNSICPSGLINTTSVAKVLDDRYGGRELPHKFKFGVTGCCNNCLKAEENDIGIKGGMKPRWEKNDCCFCGLCEVVCPVNAVKINKTRQKLTIDEEKCVYCGKCVKVCPAAAWQGESGFIISFGGLYGNRITVGKRLLPIIFSSVVLYKVIDTALEFFAQHAKKGERFANMLDRVGWDLLEKEIRQVL
ncbi:4Fe-4S binding protein [Pectinatus sottacetonis]|uniref:4Fe-4S binding protein n=1 Tax=Pectinatus sottacetonis TaxID=1002795 RepID=UPI0018C5B290|nr:4Fe-4S binding protein [Pectinatus sottacetonis]